MPGVQTDPSNQEEFIGSRIGFATFEDEEDFDSIEDVKEWCRSYYDVNKVVVNPVATRAYNSTDEAQIWVIKYLDRNYVEVVTGAEYRKRSE
jgi:hypothetical protein